MGRIQAVRRGIYAASASTASGTTFDPANKSSVTSLDVTNLIATFTTGGSALVTRSTVSHTSGKWFFEAKPTVSIGNRFEVSLVNATFPMDGTNELGTTSDCVTYFNTGSIGNNNGAFTGTTSTYTLNDSIAYAVDLTNNVFWVNKNNAGWIGTSGGVTAAGDPVAGTNGIATAFTPGIAIYAAVGTQPFSDTQQITGKFTAGTVNTIPSGYTYW